MASDPSALAVKMTEKSIGLHSTFFTADLWWVAVCTQTSLEISQILRVLSTDPDASTERLEWFKEREVTEFSWLPALYFFA